MHLILSFILISSLTPLSCSSEKSSISHFVDIAERVALSPQQAEELCATLNEPKHSQCLLLALDHRQSKRWISANRNLCLSVNSNIRSECWFRVAEQSLDPTDCVKANSFQQDCTRHLLSMQLVQRFPKQSSSPNFKELLQFSDELGLRFSSSKIPLTILTRHWLEGTEELRVDRCDTHPDPTFCQHIAAEIYKHRLRLARDRDLFPCDIIPPSLKHQGYDLLEALYNRFKEELCTP